MKIFGKHEILSLTIKCLTVVWQPLMISLPCCMQIFELVREKYTGIRISRRGSMFSTQPLSVNSDSDHARPISSLSISSNATEEAHQRMSLEDSLSLSGQPSSSSLGESSMKLTPRPLTPLREEAAESMPGESAHRKTSYDVSKASPKFDVNKHKFDQSEGRRPSILKISPSINSSPEGKRALHHVQFTESQQAT